MFATFSWPPYHQNWPQKYSRIKFSEQCANFYSAFELHKNNAVKKMCHEMTPHRNAHLYQYSWHMSLWLSFKLQTGNGTETKTKTLNWNWPIEATATLFHRHHYIYVENAHNTVNVLRQRGGLTLIGTLMKLVRCLPLAAQAVSNSIKICWNTQMLTICHSFTLLSCQLVFFLKVLFIESYITFHKNQSLRAIVCTEGR